MESAFRIAFQLVRHVHVGLGHGDRDIFESHLTHPHTYQRHRSSKHESIATGFGYWNSGLRSDPIRSTSFSLLLCLFFCVLVCCTLSWPHYRVAFSLVRVGLDALVLHHTKSVALDGSVYGRFRLLYASRMACSPSMELSAVIIAKDLH